MSEIENLEFIRDKGISEFIKKENKKWACLKCDGVISCHTKKCLECSKKAE